MTRETRIKIGSNFIQGEIEKLLDIAASYILDGDIQLLRPDQMTIKVATTLKHLIREKHKEIMQDEIQRTLILEKRSELKLPDQKPRIKREREERSTSFESIHDMKKLITMDEI